MCLGIAIALNDAHKIILDNPAQAINSAADFKGMRVGLCDFTTMDVLFTGTTKSSEALFSTFYKINTFGLCDLNLTKKSVAQCRTEFMTEIINRSYGPEDRVCSEVSLSSDIWQLGEVFLRLVTWYLRGYSPLIRDSIIEEVKAGGQPGVKVSSAYVAVSVNLEKSQAPCVSIAGLTDRLIVTQTTL